jgi:Crinkler effector protein N-terminal domain
MNLNWPWSAVVTITVTPNQIWHQYVIGFPSTTALPTSVVMSGESFALNCLVLGNKPPSAFVFTVNIPRNETISNLQAAIKSQSKPTLDDDEDLLDLRSISVVIDENFDSKLAYFSPNIYASITSQKLQRSQELGDTFTKPVTGDLHIAVQRPDAG